MSDRVASPQFDEGIYSDGQRADGVYTVYGYDPVRKRWLVGNDQENRIMEVSYQGESPDGGNTWELEHTVWNEAKVGSGDGQTAVDAWMRA